MENRVLEITRNVLREINSLFLNDIYLSRTVPTKSYPIDENKLNQWKAAQCNKTMFDHLQQFKHYHISWETWKKALALSIAQLLQQTEYTNGHFYLVSNGKCLDLNQTILARGIWITYIFREVVKRLGYIVNDLNDYWFTVSKSQNKSVEEILFLEDFIRYGDKISIRIFNTPALNYKLKIKILAVMSLNSEMLKETAQDTMMEIAKNEELVNLILNNLSLTSSLIYNPQETEHIIFDHAGSDADDLIVNYGYIYSVFNSKELRNLPHCKVNQGTPIPLNFHPDDLFLGSLIKDANPLSNELYPPPLYFLIFGDGTIPKPKYKLKPASGNPGFYVVDFDIPTSPTMKRTKLPSSLGNKSIELPSSRQSVKIVPKSSTIQLPKTFPVEEQWNEKDVEAFCETWLEEEDYDDEQGINSFLGYALQKGWIGERTKPEDIGKLCKTFKEKMAQRPPRIKTQTKQTTNPIQIVKYKTRQELEKEEMEKLVKERERQLKVKAVWDKITSGAYDFLLNKNRLREWESYRTMMVNLLDQEYVNPTSDYEYRWTNLIPK